jgi:hypothetical protein
MCLLLCSFTALMRRALTQVFFTNYYAFDLLVRDAGPEKAYVG